MNETFPVDGLTTVASHFYARTLSMSVSRDFTLLKFRVNNANGRRSDGEKK